MFFNYEHFLESGDNYLNSKDFASAKLEYEKALNAAGNIGRKLKSEITEKIALCSENLADVHFQYGENYYDDKIYNKAIDEFNAVLLLTKDSAKIKKVEKKIKEVETVFEKENLLEMVSQNLTSGEEFLQSKDYGEAYVEFKEAYDTLKNFSVMKEELESLKQKLSEIEHSLISKYMSSAKKYVTSKKYEEAVEELEYARAIVDDFASDDVKEIENLYKKIKKEVLEDRFKGQRTDKEKVLEKAIERFENATDLFFKFGFSDVNPYNPGSGNKYMAEYNNSRRDLSMVYELIGDDFMGANKLSIAFKFYNDALNLLNENEAEYKEVNTKLELLAKMREKNG
ncbi:MAG: hypothetical protein WC002_09260 [Candidatus Muiribacteriota bacterium]